MVRVLSSWRWLHAALHPYSLSLVLQIISASVLTPLTSFAWRQEFGANPPWNTIFHNTGRQQMMILKYLDPVTHMEDPDGVPASWLQPAPAPAVAVILGMMQQMENFPQSLFLCL